MYIIMDWAGIDMNLGEFDSFEQACDCLYQHVTELTTKELYEGNTEYKDYDFDTLWEINLDEFQVIEENENE